MWQTARAAPVITPVVTVYGRASIVFSLNGLRPCSDQQPASRQKGNEWLRGHGAVWSKTGFSAQPTQPGAARRGGSREVCVCGCG